VDLNLLRDELPTFDRTLVHHSLVDEHKRNRCPYDQCKHERKHEGNQCPYYDGVPEHHSLRGGVFFLVKKSIESGRQLWYTAMAATRA
jgi:hypothetical protein